MKLNKPHGNNTLSNLPVEDQQRLLDWRVSHTIGETIALAAQPRPEGLGLKTSFGSLSRFCTNTNQEDLVQIRLETLALADNLARSGGDLSSQVQPVLLQTIEEKALRELLDPDLPLASQTRIAHTVIRVAALKQQVRKAAQKDQDLEIRRQSRRLAAQRHNLELLSTLRGHFPVISQIDWASETEDALALERLKHLFGFTTTMTETNVTPHTSQSAGADETLPPHSHPDCDANSLFVPEI